MIFKKQCNIKQQYTPSQFSCLRKLFTTILKTNQIKPIKIDLPQKAIQQLNLTSMKCYALLICCVINQKFLLQATQQVRIKIYNYLNQLLFNKKSDFRLAVQNRKLRIFTNIIKSLPAMQGRSKQKYSQLIMKLIITHQANQILLKKISYLFYQSYGTKSKYLQNLFQSLLQKIFSVLNHNQNEQNYHIKILGKYFLSTHKNLQLIFTTSNNNIKTKILDSMIDDQLLNLNCHKLFQQLTDSQLLQFNGWLIVYGKKNMFQFFQQKKESMYRLSNLIFFVTELARLYLIQHDQTHRQQIILILHNFIKKSSKRLNQKNTQRISQSIQNFYYFPSLIKLIAQNLYTNSSKQIKSTIIYNFVHGYFNVMLNIMPKIVTLRALQQFRKLPEYSFDCCVYLLRLEETLMLPERNLSAFLQYLIQMLFTLKHQEQSTSNLKQLAIQINKYILKLTKNYSKQNKISQLSQPFLYSFPKMEKKIDFNDSNYLKKLVNNIRQAKVYQIKGGICFKLICIIFHILQILPEQNHLDLLIFCVDKMGQKNKTKNNAAYRAISDFPQVSKDTKNRSYIQPLIQEHRIYFQNFDQEIMQAKSPIRRSNSKINMETDLTSFFIDFFFMKIFMYLQNHCTIMYDYQQLQIYTNYSKNILKYLRQYEQIFQQMNQKNAQSNIKFENVQDLTKLLQKQEDPTISDLINSPNFSRRLIYQTYKEMDKSQIDRQFLQPPKSPTSPKSPKMLRRNTNVDVGSARKMRKKQLITNIQGCVYTWSQQAKQKQLHRYFRQQSKQILFNQLLHQLYIVSSSYNAQRRSHIPKGKRLIGFLQDIGYQFTQHDKNNDDSWKLTTEEIRRVQKFTCRFVPPIQLNLKSFPNLTYPFTHNTINYPQNKIQNNPQNIFNPTLMTNVYNLDNHDNQDIQQIYSPQQNMNTVIYLQDSQTSQTIDNLCEVSTVKGVYFCEWQISNQSIKFTSKAKKQTNKHHQRILKYGSPICNIIPQQNYKICIKVQDILQIFFRKYNQIKDNSLEFFLGNGKSVYAIFYTKQKTKSFLDIFKKTFSQSRSIKIVENFIKDFENQRFTQKWKIGQLSNFDYLMLINKYSGRSHCDLNQYYIFPWILQDYTSKTLDISNSKIYRDLKKPIGALRQQKFEKYLEKLTNQSTLQEDKYIYGSHYSTSLFIYYYLVRLQPFTSLHKDMQSGDFDAPDRLFSSIQQMWECLISQSSTSDIKQAIPQFYYFPTFLKNINKLNLGVKQSGKILGDVQLPPWAENAADFILKMRACLQSDFVSSNLNYWIDLIFGKDQKSREKQNVFHPLSYVENISPEKIDFNNLDAVMSQITFFGQNPYVLFTRQHPKKKLKINSINFNQLSLQTSQQFLSKQLPNKNFTLLYEQQTLEYIHYITTLQFQTKKIITLKISGISKNSSTKSINLDMQNTIHTLIRAIQNIDNLNMKRLLSQNNIQIPDQKIVTTNYKINQNEFQINITAKNKRQTIKKIKLNYKFKGIRYNQIVFVTYGYKGLKVYDWNQQILWQFSNQYGQISQCYLDINLLFFTTSNGKLFVYDFFGNFKQLLFQYAKPTFNVMMLVYPEAKFVTKRNQNSYKIVIVGDKRKIILIHYTHRIGKSQIKI